MYIPRYYQVTDIAEMRAFIRENPFGTMVTTHHGKPIASHLPLELHKRKGDYYVTGHMAYANPQWRTFEESKDNVLVMFNGPEAYISSSWYQSNNVPTWNYQAVHVYGYASVMTEEELQEDLTLLLKKYEQDRENAALWEDLSLQTKRQIKGIVGFKIKVLDMQAAYKLSQNRNETDYRNIISKLYEEDTMQSKEMAELMEDRLKEREKN